MRLVPSAQKGHWYFVVSDPDSCNQETSIWFKLVEAKKRDVLYIECRLAMLLSTVPQEA